MDDKERKKRILDLLKENTKAISGSVLAKTMGVTRQIIIKDIALLRAAGNDIVATPRGYVMKKDTGIQSVFAVKHSIEDIERELTLIINGGGRVINVIIEHPLYGEIIGNLDLKNLDDVKRFIAKMATSNAKPLINLSEGVHLHTIEADSVDTLDKIRKALLDNGFLLTK